MNKTTFINVNLLNGEKDMVLQENVNVEVTDGIITKIGNFEIDKSSKIVDIYGDFMVPGLINLHSHLPSSGKLSKKKLGDKSKLVNFVSKNPIGRIIGNMLVKKYALMSLNSGVTTVRTVGGVSDFDSRLRDKINSGKLLGPRLLVSNTAIGVKGGHMDKTVAKALETKEEISNFMNELISQKVDLIKLMITGGVLDGKEEGHPAPLRMEKELVKYACEEAHKNNLKVAAHVESPEGMEVAIECGVDSIEHGSTFDEKLLKVMKEKNEAVVLTLSPAIPFANIDPDIVGYGKVAQVNSRIILDGMIKASKFCLENDIPVGLGTDAGSTLSLHYNFYKELIYYVTYLGVTNNFALYSATLGNAKIAGISDVTGSIEVGKSADLLIVKGNPLDDLNVLGKLVKVVMNGKIISKPKFKRDKVADSLLKSI